MTDELDWAQPSLFTPDQVQWSALSARLDLHYLGPDNLLEVWSSISDPTGGWLTCHGPQRVTLGDHRATLLRSALVALDHDVMRRLCPF